MPPESLSSAGPSGAPAGSAFPATLWAVVRQARSEEPGQALEALHTLCVQYQRAIHAWFQRSRPHWIPPARAEEWAQDFLLFMQDKNPFRRLERRESRFRSFLVSCLKNFLKDKLDAERAAKRGGDTEHVDISELEVAGRSEALDEILDSVFAPGTARARSRSRGAGLGAERKSSALELPGAASWRAITSAHQNVIRSLRYTGTSVNSLTNVADDEDSGDFSPANSGSPPSLARSIPSPSMASPARKGRSC